MSLARFTLSATPSGPRVTVNGQTIPAARVVLESAEHEVPRLSVWTTGDGQVQGDGVVQVVREPTAQEVDDAALDAIARVDQVEFERRCAQAVASGRRDPYRVALEVLAAMARG